MLAVKSYKHKYYGIDVIDWDYVSTIKPVFHADTWAELCEAVSNYQDDCECECMIIIFEVKDNKLVRFNKGLY